MVIDDEFAIRELVSLILSDEFEVLKAKNEEDARAMFLHKPSLILLDIMMPKLDGLDFLEKIRQAVSCPVIMLTAKNDAKSIRDSFNLGAVDYIIKPFEPEMLIRKVKDSLVPPSAPTKYRQFSPVGDMVEYN